MRLESKLIYEWHFVSTFLTKGKVTILQNRASAQRNSFYLRSFLQSMRTAPSQVIVPDSFKGIVSMEIVATDVVRRVGRTESSQGNRRQLGLNKTRVQSKPNSYLHCKWTCKRSKTDDVTHREFDYLFTTGIRRILKNEHLHCVLKIAKHCTFIQTKSIRQKRYAHQ